MKFCDNTICRCHVEAPEQSSQLTYVEANCKLVTAARHEIVIGNTDSRESKRFFFCDTCASAVAMINSPQ